MIFIFSHSPDPLRLSRLPVPAKKKSPQKPCHKKKKKKIPIPLHPFINPSLARPSINPSEVVECSRGWLVCVAPALTRNALPRLIIVNAYYHTSPRNQSYVTGYRCLSQSITLRLPVNPAPHTPPLRYDTARLGCVKGREGGNF